MVTLRPYTPLYSAAELLGQANKALAGIWDPTDNIDFNQMVDQQSKYDQNQRQADYNSQLADQMPDAATPEDVANIRMEAAKKYGLGDEFDKEQKRQEEEQLKSQLKDIGNSTDDIDQIIKEAKKTYLQSGNIKDAVALKNVDERKVFSNKGAITTFDPTTGEVQHFGKPTSGDGTGGKPTYARFLNPDTGEVSIVNTKDPKALAGIGLGDINLSKPGVLGEMKIEQIQRTKKEDKARQSKQPDDNSPGIVDQAKQLLSSFYNNAMPSGQPQRKTLIRRQVVR